MSATATATVKKKLNRTKFKSGLATESAFLENRGPESLIDLVRWDKFVIQRLIKHGICGRAADCLQHGCVMYSDYSGMDLPREAVRVAVPSMAKMLNIPEPQVVHVRSCDWDEVPLFVLKRQSRMLSNRSVCVFGDLSERVPEHMRGWMDAAMPATKDPMAMQRANQLIAEHLEFNAGWAFTGRSTSYCHAHNYYCPSYPAAVYFHGHEFVSDVQARPAVLPPPRK